MNVYDFIRVESNLYEFDLFNKLVWKFVRVRLIYELISS
jgi:hypothetical protein